MVDSFHSNYVGYSPMSQIYLIYTTILELKTGVETNPNAWCMYRTSIQRCRYQYVQVKYLL